MMDAIKETVVVSVPSGGQVDPYTQERVSGGTATLHDVTVAWVVNPKREVVLAQGGGFVGLQKVADCAALYEAQEGESIDWNAWMRPDVTVTRRGIRYVVVGVADWEHRGWQVVHLKQIEGA